MSIGLEKLKDVGAQKIHEKTHIVKTHVQAILHENFDDMNKIQFLGFISILEREYNISLDDLKEKGLEYFDDYKSITDLESQTFIAPKSKKNMTKFYIAVAIFIFVIFAVINIIPSTSTDNNITNQELDNRAIESAKSTIMSDDVNSSLLDVNQSEEEVSIESIEIVKSFKVIPKSKLWLGYIELGDHKKYQKTISDELTLDPSKEWLLSLGHGNVDFDVNGEKVTYKTSRNMRFLYRDGNLSQIDFSEFKRLNKGNEW